MNWKQKFSRLIMLRIAAWLIILLCADSYGQTYKPADFTETLVPADIWGNQDWFKLNHTDMAFAVSNREGELIISRAPFDPTKELPVFELPNGMLSGDNHWGGQLIFKPIDKTKKEIVVKQGKVSFIFQFHDEIYFIETQPGFISAPSVLYLLTNTGDTFSYTKLLDFDDTIGAFAFYNDTILIVSHQNFYVLNNFKKETLFSNMFWEALHPTSMVVINNDAFFGIRSGYVKINLPEKKVTFYKY